MESIANKQVHYLKDNKKHVGTGVKTCKGKISCLVKDGNGTLVLINKTQIIEVK